MDKALRGAFVVAILSTIICIVMLLTGCSSAISSGAITAKEHSPQFTYTTMMCTSYSAKGICTVWMPILHTSPETWRFDLREDGTEGWVYVTEQTFEAYSVGDYYSEED